MSLIPLESLQRLVPGADAPLRADLATWRAIGFATHVRRSLPAARHLEFDCGHVPQIERPEETHAAIVRFLREASPGECGDAPGLLAG